MVAVGKAHRAVVRGGHLRAARFSQRGVVGDGWAAPGLGEDPRAVGRAAQDRLRPY